MKNGLGEPQSVLLFGGTSEIGLATVRGLVSPGVGTVFLLCRDIAAGEQEAARLRDECNLKNVVVERFDGDDVEGIPALVDRLVSRVGDIDVAIVAHAVLGDGVDPLDDPLRTREIGNVNFTGTMVLLASVAGQMRRQRSGKIILFSSVAGERVRKANAPYGASKAGIDSFAQSLDHVLSEHGASVLVVRPGFVHTKMTATMDPAPFATTPSKVAKATVRAVKRNKRVIWVPGLLRWVFVVFRHLPTALWRRLPL